MVRTHLWPITPWEVTRSCNRNKGRNFSNKRRSCSHNTKKVAKFGLAVLQVKLCLLNLNLLMTPEKIKFFAYKCKLRLALAALNGVTKWSAWVQNHHFCAQLSRCFCIYSAGTTMGHKFLVVITRCSHQRGLQNSKMIQWFYAWVERIWSCNNEVVARINGVFVRQGSDAPKQ